MPSRAKKKCVAGIKLEACAYKRDLGQLGKRFSDLDLAIGEFRKELLTVTHIKLNGDDKLTPFPDVIKEMYHATLAQRKTNKLKEAFSDWKSNTKMGQLFETKIGRIAGYIIIIWMIISSLNTLGIKGINPVQFIEWIITHLKYL